MIVAKDMPQDKRECEGEKNQKPKGSQTVPVFMLRHASTHHRLQTYFWVRDRL